MAHKEQHLSHKQKRKAAIAARNKRDNRVNIQADLHEENLQQDREREKELHEAELKRTTDADGNVVWSARLQEVRNRLNGKKRMADDRWNRFAGTSGGGGRGR